MVWEIAVGVDNGVTLNPHEQRGNTILETIVNIAFDSLGFASAI